ncbi:MAG: glycosyltransferase [Gemmatimonadales bacterium]
MTDRCRVSVVIPAYNVGRFIDEALASVADQRRPAHEVIVVDDGSTDDTNARVRAWNGRCGSTPLHLLDGPNRGLSVSRNRGILASCGELLAFLDGDDCYLPHHLERLVPVFSLVPGLVVAFGDLARFEETRGELGGNLELIRAQLRQISTPIDASDLQLLGPDLRAVFVDQAMILPSSWVVSRTAVARAGMFDPTVAYAEDLDFLWRVLGTGPAAWFDGPTARRREHDNNASNPRRAAWSEPEVLRVVARLRRASPGRTAAESRALERLMTRTLFETGWLAAGDGLGRYLAWRDEAKALCGHPVPFSMRLSLRAIRSGIGRAHNER